MKISTSCESFLEDWIELSHIAPDNLYTKTIYSMNRQHITMLCDIYLYIELIKWNKLTRRLGFFPIYSPSELFSKWDVDDYRWCDYHFHINSSLKLVLRTKIGPQLEMSQSVWFSANYQSCYHIHLFSQKMSVGIVWRYVSGQTLSALSFLRRIIIVIRKSFMW